MKVFERPQPLLQISRNSWNAMIAELGRRGRGDRESGAFLLADRNGDGVTVTQVVYFDDLDPTCLVGGIRMNGLAFSKLWDICSSEQRRVVADVHTHFTADVRQSGIDADNPMIAQAGHVALIVPHLATRAVKAKAVGVHRYRGDGWQSWTGRAAKHKLRIARFR